MKRKLLLTAVAVFITAFTGLAIYGAIHNQQVIHSKNIQIESKTFKLQKLETEFKQLNADYKAEADKKDADQNKLKEYEDRIQKMEADYKALEVSKANEKAEKARLAQASQKIPQAVVPKASASPTNGNCGDNQYKQYIYMKESGCRTTAVNSIGCRGIGQACPGSKLPCGDDFACQDAWFSNYAIQRYGSWEKAYAFWLNNHWW